MTDQEKLDAMAGEILHHFAAWEHWNNGQACSCLFCGHQLDDSGKGVGFAAAEHTPDCVVGIARGVAGEDD